MTFSDRLGQMQLLKEPGQHRVVNERDTDPLGTIWTSGYLATSRFLINEWCSRRQSCINTCWEAAVTWRGTALRIITWSQHPQAHIKAEHVGHPIFFLFPLVLLFTPHTAQPDSVSCLPPCEPWGAELPGQHVCSIRASVNSWLTGCTCPAIVWYGHKPQTILAPISWEGKASKTGWIVGLTQNDSVSVL